MTKQVKFTSGPWIASPSVPSDGVECYYIFAHEVRGNIGSVYGPQRGEQEANARLIAAAPELLPIAEWIVAAWKAGAVHECPAHIIADAEQAIAKARGQA